jgi:hypothetical protein
MPRFKFLVTESRTYSCEYEVEANTYEEAVRKASVGDTIDEDDRDDNYDVVNREVTGDL